MSGKFDQLESDVDSKQQSLVDDLASKYVEAKGKVDEEIKAEQENNKGFVAKAKDAVMGAIDTILKLKALFMGLLAKAASAFSKILEDPIKFISNFMSAVKQGFMSFAGNILTHLKKGLLGWLFGALANAGIELPDSFDFKGILKLVGSILGLTWTNIKARIVKIAPWVGKVIDVIESKIEVFTILATQGIGGLWNWIKKQLNNLSELIITPIKEFVIEKIVTAGISWVFGMLNPAGALVKVVQALIGVVQWIMERGAALMDFVGTVIDAVSDIANGGVGGVPAKIEAALGKAVPLVIAFLANLLGLGGISDKIKSILKAVQAPINKALDFVIKGALKLAGPLIKGIKGIGAKVKAKVLGGDDSPEGKKKRLDKGMASGVSAANRFAGKKVGEKVLKPVLGLIGKRFGLQILEPIRRGDAWAVHGEVQRAEATTNAKADSENPDQGISKVDVEAVKSAIRQARAEKAKAVARHKKEGSDPGQVWASGGGDIVPQGQGAAPENDEVVTKMTPYIAAQMAMFSELKHDPVAMTTLTSGAARKVKKLRARLEAAKTLKTKASLTAEIDSLLSKAGSYLHGAQYEGRTKKLREVIAPRRRSGFSVARAQTIKEFRGERTSFTPRRTFTE